MMRRSRIGWVKVLMAGFVLVGTLGGPSPAGTTAPTSAADRRPFVVFDATLYKNKPSFAGYPIRPITLLYEARLFPGKHAPTAMPPEETVRSIGKELSGASQPVIVDIERWPLKGNPKIVKENVGKLLTVLSWIKAEAPNIQLGTYGTIPLPDYWRAIRGPVSKEHQAWQRDNDQLDEMVVQLDALYPSLYTYYPDRQGWVNFAVAQLTEAKRKANGKPVYAFLMPIYHESNRQLGLRPLESDYWELQLNTVVQHADGVVIWGGWGTNGPEPWDEEAPWWQVTKRFMGRIGGVAPGAPLGLKAQ
jgi:Hyaluronidase